MTRLLVAEELLLLALNDEKGTTGSGFRATQGLGGALLADLMLAGAVDEENGRVVARAGHPDPGHPLLVDALAPIRASAKPRKPKYWVVRIPDAVKPVERRVAEGLVGRGIVSTGRRKALGLFERTVYPAADPAPELEIRARLEAALLQGLEPEDRTLHLIALIDALGMVGGLASPDRRREAKRAAKAMAKPSVVGDAVRRAIQDAS